MQIACTVPAMPAIQIRNVPDRLHRELKARAAQEGLSLSDYLLAELRALGGRPSMAAWLEKVSAREPVRLTMTPAEAIAMETRRER
jgi:plasmid stability protein